MFDIGFSELVLIALIALVVLGPERLPGAARTTGALLRKLRESWNNVRSEVERELQADELRQNLREAREQARRAEAAMRETMRRTDQGVRGSVEALRSEVTGAPPPDGGESAASAEVERSTEGEHGAASATTREASADASEARHG